MEQSCLMNYTSTDIGFAARVTDKTQFMQDIRRHGLPIYGKKFNGVNRYDFTGFAMAMVVGELREYGLSLACCGRLMARIDLDHLSHMIDRLETGEIHKLIVLIPQQNDLDHEFPPAVSSWNEVIHYAQEESINFIPCAVGELLKAKMKGEW